MILRAFRPGDEAIQTRIYNEAAQSLSNFVPAQAADVMRRVQENDFDPQTRVFACDNDVPVGYIAFQQNGRLSYPWCRAGHESARGPLFEAALEAMRRRGIKTAFAAYRGDWKDIGRFFLKRDFRQAREMVNFAVELSDLKLPEPAAPRPMTPLREQDLPAILQLVPGALRAATADQLQQHLFRNPCFGPESLFMCRQPGDARQPAAVGIVVEKPNYADPRKVNSDMPCFRLGAFGTEGMTVKRINGLFSLLAPDGPQFASIARDMLSHGVQLLRQAGLATAAAQAASDVPHLIAFHQKYFHRQGSFPVYERDL
jgi:hypothetical protein